ncbi:hypothetical protein BASA83_013793 [Batrachochytrium salamandrivorans]|nr:hypothetical protein BASA83_013793 [Batrachochytrium salamandrivorans]
MQSDVYPFVEVSPISDVSVPSDILSSFSSLFSEDQAETLLRIEDFDCSIDLKPVPLMAHLASSSSKKTNSTLYGLSRSEQEYSQGSESNSTYFRTPSNLVHWQDLHYLGLARCLNLLRIKEGDESKTSFITKVGRPKKVGTCKFCWDLQTFIVPHPRLLQHDSKPHQVVQKDAPFVWGPEQEKSLQDLKTAFANSDFLLIPDDSRPFILETDASDYAISRFHDDQEVNRRQARWSLELSEYDFSLTHRPGKLNGRADSLSRREDYKSNSESSNFQRIWILRSHLGEMQTELKHFRFRDNSFLRILEDGKSTAAYVTTDKRVDVMKHHHTSLAHLKYGSIIDLLLRRFWWPSMKKDLKDFIARCPECQLDRSSSGIHAPLPIRPVPPVLCPLSDGDRFLWSYGETKSGNKYLITCIDYATRGFGQAGQGHDESAVSAFLYELMMTYGAPFEIISDRGKSFLAEGIDLFERENKIRHLARLLIILD